MARREGDDTHDAVVAVAVVAAALAADDDDDVAVAVVLLPCDSSAIEDSNSEIKWDD